MVATDAIMVDGAREAKRPYAPSWLNRLIGWIDALPGPAWLAYVAIAGGSVLLSNAQAWVSGLVPTGEFQVEATYWGVFLVALVWIVAYLDGVAARAFESFRPALALAEDEMGRLRYELTVTPARPALLLAVAAVPLTLVFYVLDPSGSRIVGLTPAALFARAFVESFSTAVFLVIFYQLLRQMRSVRRILAGSTRVDIFQPAPLHAFSRLTSRTGVAMVVLFGSAVLIAPPLVDSSSFLLLWGPWLFGIPALAAAAFVVPLLGLHGRLVAEKEHLQDEAELRLKELLEELNHDVDSRDLGRADALNKTLSSVLQQRDVLAKLPTWPWSTGTFRGFVTAILLPLAIFLIQRLLLQFV